MLFHSFTFAALLIPALIIYWSVPSQTARLVTLFVASLVFYAWRHWPSAILLLATIAVNYTAARLQERRRSQRLLTVTILFDLSLLFWFKYAAFASNELQRGAAWLGIHLPLPALSSWLPLGISFFTFQVIAYQVDVYRGTVEAERSLLVFGVFKSFFPQLIAGPIVRARDFLPRLHQRAVFDPSRFHHGIFLFVAGLSLKVGVADVLRQFADEGFVSAGNLATTDAWLDIYAFAIQLFADFWGYSTMARGIGEMFALELPINFDQPYGTTSLQGFWRHWHITLSSWFRDYVYIPLGGNRTGRAGRNVVITMTAAGLWHGAGWNFILWGFLHGAWLAVENGFRKLIPRSTSAGEPSRLGRLWRSIAVFHGVCLLWVLFRAPSMTVAIAYWGRLLLPPYTVHNDVSETLAISIIGFALLQGPLTRALERTRFLAQPVWIQVAQAWVLLLLMLGYAEQKYDFIYFAF